MGYSAEITRLRVRIAQKYGSVSFIQEHADFEYIRLIIKT